MRNLAAVVLQIACAAPQQPPPARSPRVVPGELIVKFVATSEAARVVARSTAAADVGEAFASVTDRLSREVGLPLEARRVLSGGEVLLALSLPALTERLLAEVRKDEALRSAALDERAEAGPHHPSPAVRARLSRPGADVPALRARLSGRLGFALASRAAGEDEVLLFADVDAVTQRALDVLKARPDVEYAQPNYLLGKLGS
jgi:hypothetical protein